MSLVWKYKRGKTWYLKYASELGLPVECLHIRDEKVAEAIRVDKERGLVFGKFGIKDRPVQRISWSEFVRRYLGYKCGQGKAINTLDAIRAALNNIGLFLERDVPLDRVTLNTLEEYAAWKRTTRKVPTKTRQGNTIEVDRKPASEKTIRNELIILRTAFKWAIREHYLAANPADELELPKKEKRMPRNIQDGEYWRLMEIQLEWTITSGCGLHSGRSILCC